MGALQTARTYLGTGRAPVIEGFTRSSRGVRLPVCRRCGALVAYETQRAHLDWHASTAG
ncbi:hypothetical protein [Modestobacter sp. SYSU DS0290]